MTDDILTRIMTEYQYMPLRDVVFHTLRRGIMQGDLKPGERLMEIKLANRLGVSRTPIREAIRMLELEGLVVMIPRRGAQVAKITEKDLKDVLEVRLGLEELALNMACERMTEEQRNDLCEATKLFEQRVKEGDLNLIAEADVHFHDIIYVATGNERLVQLLYNLREQMLRYRIEYLKNPATRTQLISEHNSLCEMICKGDKKGAIDVMSEHIRYQEMNILEHLMLKSSEDEKDIE